MSNQDDEDITRIEDLPDFNPEEEDEDFASLDEMATDLGFEAQEDETQSNISLPELPPNDTAETSSFEDAPSFEEEAPSFEEEAPSFEEEAPSFEEEAPSFEEEAPSFEEEAPSFEAETSMPEPEPDPEPDPEPEPQPILTTPSFEEPSTTTHLTSADDLVPEPEVEKIQKTEIDRTEQETWKSPDNLSDLKEFAETSVIMDYSAEGNPPFSIIIKNVKYYEDVDLILNLLKEYKLLTDEQEAKHNIVNGQLLIPRLSEFVAIVLCHKLRYVDCELLMGLTEEIHPPKSYESNDRGLSTRQTLGQNRNHHLNINDLADNKSVLTSTLGQVDGFNIVKHLGIITESTKISSYELQASKLEDEILENLPSEQTEQITDLRLKRENKLASLSQPTSLRDVTQKGHSKPHQFNLDSIYRELVEELKSKAVEKHANAVVGINFSVTPVALENYLNTGPEYQILCTGNLVWLEKH